MSARRVTLVTGASGGIGADLARVFAYHGHDLALVARSKDKLETLANEIAATSRPRPLVIPVDLTGKDAVEAVAAQLQAADASVDILVNNAGYGLAGEAADLDPQDELGMVDLNVRALVELTLRFAPHIRAAKGGILNVASIAAYLPGPGMAVYYASKAFVRSFSRALWQELRRDGVTVTLLCPGVTLTGFQARAKMEVAPNIARFAGASAMEVAEAGYAGLVAKRRVVVPGVINRIFTIIMPLLPDALILPVVAHMQGQKLKGK
ncbi:SDR family NAD(P)-dependent oxidoreductase [Methyloferula stellata]|uniref:SDR family NAD(P)-dependent oxidoreductase n=1 Tax=Methyloferula stellata TaxID=876270 RepID=UPI000478F70F|nr:SDR family oxidoreductase [Methyloferula stellata]